MAFTYLEKEYYSFTIFFLFLYGTYLNHFGRCAKTGHFISKLNGFFIDIGFRLLIFIYLRSGAFFAGLPRTLLYIQLCLEITSKSLFVIYGGIRYFH